MILTLKDLTEAEWQDRRARSTMPDYALARTTFSDKKANSLTIAIIQWFRLSGGQAERISVTGRLIDNRKTYVDAAGKMRTIGSSKWIKSSMNKGSGDISAIFRSKSIRVEIKIGKDRQSDDQKNYQQNVERAGGMYLIVKSWDNFIEQITKSFKE